MRAVFRRGRRHEAPPEQSLKGVEAQSFWLAEQTEPGRLHVAPEPALLSQDSLRGWAEQHLAHWHRARRRPSALPGVSTQEVLDELGASFSPVELDWELVGVTFVHAIEVPAEPESPVEEALIQEPPKRPLRIVHGIGAAVARKKRRKWLREHDEIMTVVRDLSWEGYVALIADIFRREGYEVFMGEGPDGDVIDMEVEKGASRMLVNCQLRGLTQIDSAPLAEMAAVAARNSAEGAFIISDGDFAPEAWALADEVACILIDRDMLLGLVLDFTMGIKREKRLTARLARFVSAIRPRSRQRAS
jgi:hypothetical protein